MEIDNRIIERILRDHNDKLAFPKTVQHYKRKANIIFWLIVGVVASGFIIFILAGTIPNRENTDIKRELLDLQNKQNIIYRIDTLNIR